MTYIPVQTIFFKNSIFQWQWFTSNSIIYETQNTHIFLVFCHISRLCSQIFPALDGSSCCLPGCYNRAPVGTPARHNPIPHLGIDLDVINWDDEFADVNEN
jgi:hypothetical protein